MKCSKCDNNATNNYGPLGYLCPICEKKCVSVGEFGALVVYGAFLLFGTLGVIFFLAHVG
jgi:hypothetical protein